MEVNSGVGVMIRSSNLNNSIAYQPNPHPGRIGRGASSRFKGVLKLNSNNWGARISLMYKPYWLGTYQTEEEAALAYDTAAIKLQRGDSSLNFPLACHSVQESAFQSQYMNEQILEMIRDKTYSSRFAEFMAGKAMMMEAGLRNSLNQRGVLYKMIFHKQLMQSDFAENKNFLIPKEYALEYLPQLSPTGSGGDAVESKFIDLILYDKHCRSWTFRYAYWNSTDSFMFTRGWRHFIKMNSLSPGDTVILYKGGYDVNFERNVFYFIDVHRDGCGIQAGSNMRQEVSQIENADNGVDVDPKGEEEINNGVVLFGVQIG